MKYIEKEDIDRSLARHFADEVLTDTQNAELEKWIKENPEEYDNLKKLMAAACPADGEKFFDAEKAWAKVEPQLTEKVVKVDFRSKTRTYLSIAASFAVLVVITMFYLLGGEETNVMNYANNGTVKSEIILPDGSKVSLYPESRLAFADGKERKVQLTGKAFFEVKKDNGRSFSVETDKLNVRVLGTSFLVDGTAGDGAGVFVRTGRVEVASDNDKVVITANEKAELKNGKLNVGVIEEPDIFFGDGDMFVILRDVPVKKAVAEIEKKTGVRIELGEGVEENRITTRIDIRNVESIAAEMAMVCGCNCDTVVPGKHYRLYYE